MCMRDCPSAAITIKPVGEKKFVAEIDLAKCLYCAQCVDTCPKKALEATPDFELAQLEHGKLLIVLGEIGETAPENLTGEIKKFQPTHLIIIDAAELNKEPGHIEIMEPETIGGTSFCTHSLPLKVIIGYLLESFKFQAIIIGIQPKTLTFGAQPTKEVVAAAKHLAKTITKSTQIKKPPKRFGGFANPLVYHLSKSVAAY